MSSYNARRTVESLIFPYTFALVVKEGVPDEYKEDREKVLADLNESIHHTMPKSLTEKETAHLERRTYHLLRNVIAEPFRTQKMPVAKLGLTAFYMLKNIVEQGAFYIAEDGALQKALDVILPSLTEWTEKEKLNRSAMKAARRTYQRLQAEGYFCDVPWIMGT